MKTIFASVLALGLFAGAASASTAGDVFKDMSLTAPKTVFDDLKDTSPRSPFDEIRATSPRSIFDEIRETSPRSGGVFGGLARTSP